LQNEVVKSWHYLIDYCEGSLVEESAWLSTLVTYLNSCISLVEITLNQLYYKAKYDSQNMNWIFDEERLGTTIYKRMSDKFKWIGRITNKPLDNAELEIKNFKKLKALRNHLNHFDPPAFAYTIEDIADWLSAVSDIGKLLIKVRMKLHVDLSDRLVEMALLPKVNFVPKDPNIHRFRQGSDVGYRGCIFET